MPPELAELLERVEGNLTEKVRRVALVILNLTASAKAAHAEAERIAAMARGYERQTESLKRYLMFQLERAGTSRVETPTVKVRIQKNTRPKLLDVFLVDFAEGSVFELVTTCGDLVGIRVDRFDHAAFEKPLDGGLLHAASGKAAAEPITQRFGPSSTRFR
ncbi:MAG: siphovirus Gp157 family protein [Gemmatimonadota bacterium]